MSRMTPAEFAATIGSGLLSFPVTHFDANQQFVEKEYREHCAWMLDYELAGLFAAGGTGEFFSLTPAEVDAVVKAAVAETAGKTPVVAGAGYGTAIYFGFWTPLQGMGVWIGLAVGLTVVAAALGLRWRMRAKLGLESAPT